MKTLRFDYDLKAGESATLKAPEGKSIVITHRHHEAPGNTWNTDGLFDAFSDKITIRQLGKDPGKGYYLYHLIDEDTP